MNAQILSIQLGRPQLFDDARPWTSGIIKQPVTEPVWLGATGLRGDGQADQVNHGGPHKAVCVYAAAHYPQWRQRLGIENFGAGAFGENLTLTELTEHDVCIGDVWAIGEVRVQVSQPRQPCWKLARRWNIKDLVVQVQQTGQTGWYLRTLVEGFVQQTMPITLTDRPHPQWTIAAANQIMYHGKQNTAAAAELASVAELSPSWQATLAKRG